MHINSLPVRILHIEDSRSDALLISTSLKRSGMNFHTFLVETKEEYIKALKHYHPDIILSDHSLPSFDSMEALEILQKTDLNIPFILLTGAVKDDFAVEMLKKGAKDYILKDRPERLSSSIENALANVKLEEEKRSYQEKLVKSERKFRRLIEASSDIICILTPTGKVEYISKSTDNILGLSEKDFLDKNILDVLLLDTQKTFTDALDACVANPEIRVPPITFSMNLDNGNLIHLQAKFTNLINDPDVNGIMAVLRDITIQKNSELQVKESEKKYRSFFENSMDGILLTSIDGRIHAANPAACEIFQRTEEEICNSGREELVDVNDLRLTRALREREKSGKVKAELTMFRKNGSSFPAELSSSIFYTDADPVAKTSMIIRDITEKKHYEKELLKSEERYRSLFELNPLPVFIFGQDDLVITDVNNRASEIYLYSKTELRGMSLKKLKPEEEVENLENVIETNRNNSENFWWLSTLHRKKDGTIMNVEINSYRFFIDAVPYIIAVCNDVTEKQNNVKRLKKTSDKLQIAEKIAKLGYWEHNSLKDSIYCSNEIYSIFGVQKDFNLDLKYIRSRIHPDDRENHDKEIERIIKEAEDHDLEYRIISKDGTVKWVHELSRLNKDEKGNIIGAKGTLQDITSQKRITEEIVKSEARYKALFHSQTNYFVRISMQGNYVFCNQKFIEDFGWMFPDDNPIGHSALTDVMDYHHQAIFEVTGKCIESPNRTFQIEIDKRLKGNKGAKTTLWDMIFLNDENGGEGEMQCVGIDISKRIKAEKDNRFQASLLNKIGQGIIAKDEEFKVVYWNKAAEKMYGWKQEQVLGENIMELLYVDYNEIYQQQIKPKFEMHSAWSGQLTALKKDGTQFPVQITKSPFFNGNKFSGSISISSDITDLKKSEIELKKLNNDLEDYTNELLSANKGMEQFSYIVSHNLRAPVANILGIASLLEDVDEPFDIGDILFQQMFSNVERLDNVIKDLNDILSVKTDFAQQKELVNFNDLVESVTAINQSIIDKENVKVITDFSVINEYLTVKSYVYSIFYNLVSNSIKYRKKDVPAVINIKSEIKDNKLVLIFRDNGLGIDLNRKKDQIFGLYKRFHDHVEGKGMGLFMVKTQVEILGGKIDVESQVEEGTKFVISFPQN